MQKFNYEELQKIIEDKYNEFSLEEKAKLYELYSNSLENLDELNEKLKLLIFKKIPPTGAEFLNPANNWLPKSVIDSIFPHVKEDFLNIVDGKKNYFQLCFYGGTRLGKTFFACLMIIYTIVFIHHLREPALFYGLSPLTDLVIYFISFKFDQTKLLYLKPIYKILEKSERFIQVKFQDKVKVEQKKYGCEKIVYSKSAVVGEITLASGLQILLGNDDPTQILGANVFQAYISEISFFCERAGASEEEIFRLYTDAYSRIRATVGKDYLTYVFLDSSANVADSLIENHVINNLQFDKDTYFRWRNQWECNPKSYPIWLKTKKTFKVITGNNSIPAQIVTDDSQLVGVPNDLIIDVPVDVEDDFKINLLKSIKDIAGKPTSNESRFIQHSVFIDNIFNNIYLKNILTNVQADALDKPEGLIWNFVKDTFFVKSFENKNIFYRANNEPRFIGLDCSFSASGDAFGFAMIHKEYSRIYKKVIYVIDFCFAILPREKAINTEAVTQFILDLQYKGNVFIKNVFSDTFQISESIKQGIERKNIEMIKQSVDRDTSPYQFLLTLMANDEIKGGKNIYLKNNLYCLKSVEGKIDHPKGTVIHSYNGDWVTSQVGINAKDISDAVCQAVWGAKNIDYIPTTCYEDENAKFSNDIEIQNKQVNKALEEFGLFL